MGKIKLLLAVILLNSFVSLWSQSLNWAWAKKISGPYTDAGTKIITDKAGNVYAAGYFNSWLSINSNTINSNGGTDAYILKCDPNGNILKFLKIGSANSFSGEEERITAMDIDPINNHLYISGIFNTSNFIIGTYTLPSSMNRVFYAKLDTSLNVILASAIKCTGVSNTHDLKVDTVNQCFYMAGNYLGGSVIGSYTLPSGQFLSQFSLIKFDFNGNHIWFNKFYSSSSSFSEFTNIEIDTKGNPFLTGFHIGDITLGTYTNSAGSSYKDGFILKCSKNNGSAIWAKFIKSIGHDEPYALKINQSDEMLIGGAFGPNSTSSSNSTLTIETSSVVSNNYDYYDSFACKMDSSGNVIWLKKYGGTSNDLLYSLAIDKFNNVLIAGTYNSGINLGSQSFSGSNGSYVSKLNGNDGSVFSSTVAANNVYLSDFCLDNNNNGYLTGYFQTNSSFGPHAISAYTVYGSSYYDIFYAKINNPIITGLSDNAQIIHDKIYPNPTNGTLYLPFHALFNDIQVVDALGKNVSFSGNYFNSGVAVVLDPVLTDGIYFIQVKQGEALYNHKILLKR